MLMTCGQSPMKGDIPTELHSRIMLASLSIGLGNKSNLIGGGYNPKLNSSAFSMGNNTKISLAPSTPAETERIFQELAEDGGKINSLSPNSSGDRFMDP